MKRDVRDIRKQFRLTDEEEKQILALMREQGDTNFSDFLRKSLLSSDLQKQIEIWFTLWQSQKLELHSSQSRLPRQIYEVDTWNIVTESISRKCFCLILS